MSQKYIPAISLEKFSAFLDGNLPDSEMQSIANKIATDSFLSEMVQANAYIDDYLSDAFPNETQDSDYAITDVNEASFTLPVLDDVAFVNEKIFSFNDSWLDTDSSMSLDGTTSADALNGHLRSSDEVASIANNEVNASMKEKINFGYESNDNGSTFDPNIYQGQQPTCAIRSQEIILRDYGISISQDELVDYAVKNGWYDPDPNTGGTPRDATGNLLDAMGVETRRYDNASIYDVIAELRAGHRVIVSVDANELWVKSEPKLYKRLFGELSNRIEDKMDDLAGIQGANHALIVAGVNVNPDNPSDMKVVLIDSGTGDVCIEYPFKDFKKAWDDSHCHMVATTEPAPYQYNYHTHQMEPSNFSTDFMPSMVVLPTGLHNQFELLESYFDAFRDFTPYFNANNCTIPLEEEMEKDESTTQGFRLSGIDHSEEVMETSDDDDLKDNDEWEDTDNEEDKDDDPSDMTNDDSDGEDYDGTEDHDYSDGIEDNYSSDTDEPDDF